MNNLKEKKKTELPKKGMLPDATEHNISELGGFDRDAEINWDVEIQELQSQNFSSFDEAVEALCMKVVEKIALQRTTDDGMKKFIKDLIMDNEEFCSIIKKSLK